MAYVSRGMGSRSPDSSRGRVTPHQGARESRLQGEAGQAGELGQNTAEVSRNATVERRQYETAGG